MNEIVQNYHSVKDDISSELKQCPGDNNSLQLMVVSKFHGVERIRPLLLEGHRIFGESRLDEAREKWIDLAREFTDIKLHYIGALQSRKIKEIVKIFDVIQSLDKEEAAARIAREMQSQERKIDCLIQINIGREPQKSGVLPENFEYLFYQCINKYNLNVSGIMCIPPAGEDPSTYFMEMKNIKDKYRLAELSIGMSSDYLSAIKHGSTMVRVGAKILGERN